MSGILDEKNDVRRVGMGGVTVSDGARNPTRRREPRPPGMPGGDDLAQARSTEEAQERAFQERAYPPGAPIAMKPSMTYAEAMALSDAGELERAVLTDQGWVMPSAMRPIRRMQP